MKITIINAFGPRYLEHRQARVFQALQKAGVSGVPLGPSELEIDGRLTEEQRRSLNNELGEIGAEVIVERKAVLVDRIKRALEAFVEPSQAEMRRMRVSDHLVNTLQKSYTYLSRVFSEEVGHSIEHQLIGMRIERVKDLLVRDELTLTEISYRMNYSSVAHLSQQFRVVVGVTASEYKRIALSHARRIEQEQTL